MNTILQGHGLPWLEEAKTNFTFIEKIKLENSSETITIDLLEKNALTQIKEIASKNERKILAINAISEQIAFDAILSGATAVLLQKVSPEKRMLVEMAMEQDCILVDRSSSPSYWVFPLSQLKNLWELEFTLAVEMLNYWRAAELQSFPSFLDDLKEDKIRAKLELIRDFKDLERQRTLTQELSTIIENFYLQKAVNSQNNNSTEKLERIRRARDFLARWFFDPNSYTEKRQTPCCMALLKLNFHTFKSSLILKIVDLNRIIEINGSYFSTVAIAEIIVNLRKLEIEWEQSKQISQLQAHSAEESYTNLFKALESNITSIGLFNSVIRALKLQYESKIAVEFYSMGALIVSELALTLEATQEQLIATDTFLFELQSELQQKLDTVEKIQFSNIVLDKARLSSIKDDLIEQLNCCFTKWGSDRTLHQQIESKVLQKAKKMALETIIQLQN